MNKLDTNPESIDNNQNDCNLSTAESEQEPLIECLNIEIANNTQMNDINLHDDRNDCVSLSKYNSNTSLELIQSKVEAKTLIEIVELETPNILNICSNSQYEIKDSKRGDICQANRDYKRKPTIELLTDSMNFGSDQPHIVELNNSTENFQEIEMGEGNMDESTTALEGENQFVVEQSIDNNHIEMRPNSMSNSVMRSSAITFFCENLDELKNIDNDSYESLKEI